MPWNHRPFLGWFTCCGCLMNEMRSLEGMVHTGPRDLSFHLTLGCSIHKAMKNHFQLPRIFPIKIRKETSLWLAHRRFYFFLFLFFRLYFQSSNVKHGINIHGMHISFQKYKLTISNNGESIHTVFAFSISYALRIFDLYGLYLWCTFYSTDQFQL